MTFERLVRSSRLAMEAIGKTEFVVDHSSRIVRPDRERLEGKVKQRASSGGSSARAQKLIKQLESKLKRKPPRLAKPGRVSVIKSTSTDFDARQRAVAKVHYFAHAGAGGASLKAHARYVARDAATAREGPWVEDEVENPQARGDARAHADYLDRNGQRGVFYDADGVDVNGAAKVEAWAKSDLRHFRIIISAEEGAQLRDLQAYTREVMSRAGSSLGTKLSWVAVNHHDTDNPHTHVILRGRRANGQDLVLPRDFIKHGLRGLARDVATEWLGLRTREHERQALERETRRHGPTRLDVMIEAQARGGQVRSAELEAPNGDAALTQALKSRVAELERLGLAEQTKHGVFRLADGWRDQLKSMELHLDIRKRIVRERIERGVTQQRVAQVLQKGTFDR